MKPIGMDKNGVLAYKGDKVLYMEREWEIIDSYKEGFANLFIENGSLDFEFYHVCVNNTDVVNVSERTNYERYFADLCLRDEMYGYICRGSICGKCIVNEPLCVNGRTFTMWLDEPAVKL